MTRHPEAWYRLHRDLAREVKSSGGDVPDRLLGGGAVAKPAKRRRPSRHKSFYRARFVPADYVPAERIRAWGAPSPQEEAPPPYWNKD